MYSSDNSYAVCLTDGKNHYLAGTNMKSPIKIVRKIGEPFISKVYVSALKGIQREEMILVECEEGHTHAVLNRFSDTPLFSQNHEALDFLV